MQEYELTLDELSDVDNFVSSYKDTDRDAAIRMICKLNVLKVSENVRSGRGFGRLGQRIWNNKFSEDVLPAKADVGLAPLYYSETTHKVIAILACLKTKLLVHLDVKDDNEFYDLAITLHFKHRQV